MDRDHIIQWLLNGDVSIQYQVHRDLLNTNKNDLQKKIAMKGWGKAYLDKQHSNGHWGKRFYEPKWISSHYTLLDLKNLNISPENEGIRNTIEMILDTEKGPDGGIGPFGSLQLSDVCVNGMFLNYASYFSSTSSKLESVIDLLMKEHMSDGGFNCQSNRSGATHSSLHSTISVLEGLTEYQQNGYSYGLDEIKTAKLSAIEFILMHQLFLSDRTGQIIRRDFLKLSYPSRWRYDILRALDYFQKEDIAWDDRMQPAIDVLMKKRNKKMTWNVQAAHPGQVHFQMEKAGKPSRWNTLRALRVLKHFHLNA